MKSRHLLHFMEGKSKVGEVKDLAQSLRAIEWWKWHQVIGIDIHSQVCLTLELGPKPLVSRASFNLLIMTRWASIPHASSCDWATNKKIWVTLSILLFSFANFLVSPLCWESPDKVPLAAGCIVWEMKLSFSVIHKDVPGDNKKKRQPLH